MAKQDILRSRPQQQRSRIAVAAIIDVAADILDRDGFAGLTTGAVADGAGISIGSLYRYFSDKHALAAAVVERDGHRMYECIRSTGAGSGADRIVSDTAGLVITQAVETYRVHGSGWYGPEAMRRGIFDRRAGALAAITSELRAAAQPVASDEQAILHSAAPVLAEIVVGLCESAVSRPTTALSMGNILPIAMRAGLGYLQALATPLPKKM